MPEPSADPKTTLDERLQIAVVGAHMSGLPLNSQLTELGGRLERRRGPHRFIGSTRCPAGRRIVPAWCAPPMAARRSSSKSGACRPRSSAPSCRDPRTARPRHDRPGRRLERAGLSLRGLRDQGRARHHSLRRLAGIPEDRELGRLRARLAGSTAKRLAVVMSALGSRTSLTVRNETSACLGSSATTP